MNFKVSVIFLYLYVKEHPSDLAKLPVHVEEHASNLAEFPVC